MTRDTNSDPRASLGRPNLIELAVIEVTRPPSVVVIGSINADYVVQVARRPTPGETVGDAIFDASDGGKGANQAVAAASEGAIVALVARVGDDPVGEALVEGLKVAGVETSWVRRSPGEKSGAAFVTVTPDGENTIVVAPGANALLGAPDVEWASNALREARVIVLQLETSIDAVVAAIARAGRSTTVVLNAAPARPVPTTTLKRVDILVVNEHEAATMLGGGDWDTRSALDALLALGPASAVLTLGAAGAAVATNSGEVWQVTAPPTNVVDTTGAGDVFVGVLAAALAAHPRGQPDQTALRDAVEMAVMAASRSVSQRGARVLVADRDLGQTRNG
jgi:ribokinase